MHQLTRVLRQCHTIAVVGLSAEWHRPSYFAASNCVMNGSGGGSATRTVLDGKAFGDYLKAKARAEQVWRPRRLRLESLVPAGR